MMFWSTSWLCSFFSFSLIYNKSDIHNWQKKKAPLYSVPRHLTGLSGMYPKVGVLNFGGSSRVREVAIKPGIAEAVTAKKAVAGTEASQQTS